MQKYGTFRSWEIVTDDIAIKETDATFFNQNSTVIPIKTKWFWGAGQLVFTNQYFHIDLVFEDMVYKGTVTTYVTENEDEGMTRLSWGKKLGALFNAYYESEESIYPLLKFNRLKWDTLTFQLEFLSQRLISIDAENVNLDSLIGNFEGARQEGHYVKYVRDRQNREDCLKHHGMRCKACGLKFEEKYGVQGRDFIEVHHIEQLNDFVEAREVDPRTDLVPLCANCHRMVHRYRDDILSIDKLKAIIVP